MNLDKLYLLPPSDLPTQLSISDADKALYQSILKRLLWALEPQDINHSLASIETALAQLGDISMEPAEVEETHTKLKYWEVEDYDHYFQVFHIQSSQRDRCLLYGLLTTCHRFFRLLNYESFRSDESIAAITGSRNGFIQYAHLLQRLYGLSDGT